jgi:ribonuclease Z
MIFKELKSVYNGPVVQTQDMTVFNITKESVVALQAKQFDQLPPIPGKMRVPYNPVVEEPPEWWKDSLISLE